MGRLRQPMVVGHGGSVDVDLGQVRAFVAVAERSHFGRAATELFLTQQALSKRVKRLEQTVGVELFVRSPGSVSLTPAGDRFLPYARDLLATASAAGRALRESMPAIRADVWGQVHPPLRILREASGDILLTLSMRRSDEASIGALRRGELDLAFVKTPDTPPVWGADLSYEEVAGEPMAVLVHPDHPLAAREFCTVDDLRETGLWYPELSPPELSSFFHGFAEKAGIPYRIFGTNLSLTEGVAEMRRNPDRVTILGAEWDLGHEEILRRIPLTPTPIYPWSMVWRTKDRNPSLSELVRRVLSPR